MNADEARSLANQSNPDYIEKMKVVVSQEKIIFDKIKEAAEKGEYNIEVDEKICGRLLFRLKLRGYAVRDMNGKTLISFA